MTSKASSKRNEYRCIIETNQLGKYCVRLRARFSRHGWELPAYFLASSFSAAMKKLENTLQRLQQGEDKLWFWGRERSDDPEFINEMLEEMGLQYDQRKDFPRKVVAVEVPAERPVPAFLFARVRQGLQGAVASARGAAVASD